MTEEEVFIAAGELLRDCIYLKATPKNPGDEPVAWWGGKLQDGTQHWISVKGSAFLHPETFNLRIMEGLRHIEICQLDEDHKLADIIDAKALYAHKEISWPPIELVLVNSNWISEDEKATIKEWGIRKPSRQDSTRGYFDFWMEQNPIYQNTKPHAVIGGWHGQWPDGDWWDLIHSELLLWTLQDAEPWLEVWKHLDGKIELVERVT